MVAYWNNGEKPLGDIRQALVNEARGEYIAFIDDDDQVPEYYCDKIVPLLDGVDYIGWRMQLWHNGQKLKPTFHSLKYDRWSEDANGFYRNISHLNPIKKSIAEKVTFEIEKGTAEDEPWVRRVAPFVKTENYIEEVMYYYQHSSEDSIWRGDLEKRVVYNRPEVDFKYFRYHPASKTKHIPGVH